jgi:serine/threonine-protein kinase
VIAAAHARRSDDAPTHRRRVDRDEIVDPNPPGWRLPGALLVVVVALALAVWTWSDDLFGRTDVQDLPRIELPSVAELDIATAERELESLGFVVAIVARPNESVPKGTAFGQEPVAGRKLELGELVSILVSDGPAGVVVPELGGQQAADATALLAADGIGTTLVGRTDEVVPPGEVLATDPAAGERVALGGSVRLTISLGPAPRTVPPTVGTDFDHALVAVGRAGLAVGKITRTYRKDQPEGVVLETQPPAGAQVPRDLPVAFTVTGPPPKVTVRSFIGLRLTTAQTVAKATGVTLEVVTRPVPAGDPSTGRVVAQGVPPFVQVASGSKVQVTVAGG